MPLLDPAPETPRRTLAPLPPPAAGPVVPMGGFVRQEVGDGLYVVTDGSFQMMFAVGDEEVVVVDAPPTIGANMPTAIGEVTAAPVRHLVHSHHHADHIGAAPLFPDAERYAHTDTATLLARFSDPNRPAPTRTFDTDHTVAIAGQTVQLDYRGANHSPGNLFIYVPQHKVLMLVDVIFPGWVPFENLAHSSDIPGWIAAHDHALDYPFDILIGGHLARPGTRDDVLAQQEYLDDLRTGITNAAGAVDLQAVFATVSDPANSWAIFDAYTTAIVEAAASYVTPRWTGRLGGADVYTRSNAATLAESLRIDYGVVG